MKISPEIQDSIETRFADLARGKNRPGERIISLGLGEPGFPTPPEIVEAAHQALRDGMTRYSNPYGLPALRRRIAQKLQDDNGIAAEADDILVAPGAKMALSLALGAILRPGDEIINITPCYPSYVPQIKIAEPDCVVRNVDLRKQDLGVDVAAIAQAIGPATRAVLLNFPHNPSGRMLAAGEIEALCSLFAEHRCLIISDEIYERLDHGDIAHFSFASRPELAGRVITINGFSKSHSMTGWRIGYLHVPDRDIMRTVSRLQQHLNTNTATFIQQAALVALDLPEAFLDDYNATLRGNCALLQRAVAACPNLRLTAGEGGLFSFLDISATGLTSDAFASGLLEGQSVAVTPGVVFGANWDDHIRVSMAADRATFAEGVDKLAAYAGSI